MSVSLSAEGVGGVLLDIEGTTTPIDFVHGVLFPYARAHAAGYLQAHLSSRDVHLALDQLEQEHQAEAPGSNPPPPWLRGSSDERVRSAAAYVLWLMDRDRKSHGLKQLQGMIWEQGYRTGELRGQVFADVPPALERWRRQHVDVRIFSSGSVLAQQLLFATVDGADLTTFLSGYFDTAVGPKTEPESYAAIAGAFGLMPAEILFISDVTRELDAAGSAGLKTLFCVRPGNPPQPSGHAHSVIHSLDEIVD